MHAITVRHNFETAHRLPHLPGKCQSLHGHSWNAHITVTAPTLAAGTIVEFGLFKAGIRDWIDTYLDHGSMLGPADPLLPLLRAHDCKVYEVPGWPTVENVALMLAHVAQTELEKLTRASGANVTTVRVTETAVNEAAWQAS
jgi:6-pyruvoyltetrahydropterin/6-carboxytetrahydropterin synthase